MVTWDGCGVIDVGGELEGWVDHANVSGCITLQVGDVTWTSYGQIYHRCGHWSGCRVFGIDGEPWGWGYGRGCFGYGLELSLGLELGLGELQKGDVDQLQAIIS